MQSEKKTEKNAGSARDSSGRRRKVAYRLVGVNKTTGRRIKVAVFEPEEDDDEAKPDPRRRILASAQKCWELISNNEDVRQTVQELLDAGCDWVQLLWCVDGFCQHYELPGTVVRTAFSKTLGPLSKRISKFERKISRWEATIREFNQEITDSTHVDLSSHTRDFEAYRAVLRVAQKAALPSGRKPHINEENATYLYHLLVRSTGRAHYREIADLIAERLKHANAADDPYQELANSPLFSPGKSGSRRKKPAMEAWDLRYMVKRFRKNDPQRFMSLLEGVNFGLKHIPDAWRKMPPGPEGTN
jgi:hypothetical protein